MRKFKKLIYQNNYACVCSKLNSISLFDWKINIESSYIYENCIIEEKHVSFNPILRQGQTKV